MFSTTNEETTGIDLPRLLFSSFDWQEFSLCHGADVDFFSLAPKKVEAAVAICQVCPVSSECLEFAIRNQIKDGIWGGLLPQERRNISVV